MKKMKKICTLAILAMAISVSTFAQFTAETNVQTSAHLIKAIKIEQMESLSFGNIAFSGSGDITLDADDQGNRTPYGHGIYLPKNTGNVSAAKLKVEGEGDINFSIEMPEVIILSNGGSNDESEMNCELRCSINDLNDVLIDDCDEYVEFYIGGKLFIKAGQEPGYYNAEFKVTVSYN
jgi:hypothetical protein